VCGLFLVELGNHCRRSARRDAAPIRCGCVNVGLFIEQTESLLKVTKQSSYECAIFHFFLAPMYVAPILIFDPLVLRDCLVHRVQIHRFHSERRIFGIVFWGAKQSCQNLEEFKHHSGTFVVKLIALNSPLSILKFSVANVAPVACWTRICRGSSRRWISAKPKTQ